MILESSFEQPLLKKQVKSTSSCVSKWSYGAYGISHWTNFQITSLAILRCYWVIDVIALKNVGWGEKGMSVISAFPLFVECLNQLAFCNISRFLGKSSVNDEMSWTENNFPEYFNNANSASFFQNIKIDEEKPNSCVYTYTHKDGIRYEIFMDNQKTDLYELVQLFIGIRRELLWKFGNAPDLPRAMNFVRRFLMPHLTPEFNFASKARLVSLPLAIYFCVSKKNLAHTLGDVLFWIITVSFFMSLYESFLMNEQKFRLGLSGMQRRVPDEGNCLTRSMTAQYLFIGKNRDLDESLCFLINMQSFLQAIIGGEADIKPKWLEASEALSKIVVKSSENDLEHGVSARNSA